MDHAALAERFSAASEALGAKGHRVVIRKARLLLENDQVARAISFLEDAGTRMRGFGLDALADGVRAWQNAGGQAKELIVTAAWAKGAVSDSHLAALVIAAVDRPDLRGLADELSAQQAALARGELVPLPSTRAALSEKLPTLPDRKSVAAKPALNAEIKPPVFDAEPQPPRAANALDVLKLVSQPASEYPGPQRPPIEQAEPSVPASPQPERPREFAPKPPTDDAPVVQASPEVEVQPDASEGGSGIAVVIIALIAAAIAGYFLVR